MTTLISNIKSKAKQIGLVGAVLLGAAVSGGCSEFKWRHPEYKFDGKIGEEMVEYNKKTSLGNYLQITREDGTEIVYVDECEVDLKLNRVDITQNGNKKIYRDKEFLEKSQVIFDAYLQRILEVKDSIKKADETEALRTLEGK